MKQPLWKPSAERIKNANMTRFIDFVNKRFNKQLTGYFDLYDWSVDNIADFWASVWDFVDIKASKKYEKVVDDLKKFPGTQWFTGAELNFAENLLRYRDKEVAFIFKCETKPSVRITYEELYNTVGRLASSLKEQGVKKGDRVVGYMPNMSETAIAMLATTSIGATWASCGSELGMQAVIDRFSQIEPKVLFTVDGYLYKNKPFHMLADVKEVVEAVPSIEKVVVVSYVNEKPDIAGIPDAVLYKDFLARGKEGEIVFEQVPFDHPLYIMFSSGTTG
ncbi:MAG: AMP-binding protein, partial [Proteobacteria bacterium]|nr:AMP-binding protein [Pseudomonadota bacterium]